MKNWIRFTEQLNLYLKIDFTILMVEIYRQLVFDFVHLVKMVCDFEGWEEDFYNSLYKLTLDHLENDRFLGLRVLLLYDKHYNDQMIVTMDTNSLDAFSLLY